MSTIYELMKVDERMSIIDTLKNAEEGEGKSLEETLYFKFLIAKKHFLSLDQVIKMFFPLYSLHDHLHSDVIINNLSALLLPNLIEKCPLNKYELFLLSAAAYLHDIGMIEVRDEDEEISKEKNVAISELIRNNHHVRSYEHILRFRNRLYLDDFEAKNLAVVSKGHRKEDIYKNPEYKPINCPADPNYSIRLDLLAALLRIGDELDISYKRVENHAKKALESYQKFDIKTQLHWFKHYYTIGPGFSFIQHKGSGLKTASIKIEFQIPSNEYENSFIIPFVTKPIKKEIDFLQPIFQKNGFSLELEPPTYRINNGLDEIPSKLYENMIQLLLEEKNIKALIVDDDSLSREDLAAVVGSLEYKVDCADNSVEAVSKIEKESYDLILLDIRMPNLQNKLSDNAGIDLLRYLKKNYRKSAIYIMITALEINSELVVKCLNAGALDFIEKNWKQEKIKDKIKEVIKKNFHILSEVKQ